MGFGKGESGGGVSRLQSALDRWIKGANETGQDTGLIGVIADGEFGDNTQVALATYQKWVSLDASGFADGDTLASLQLPRGLQADGNDAVESSGGGV